MAGPRELSSRQTRLDDEDDEEDGLEGMPRLYEAGEDEDQAGEWSSEDDSDDEDDEPGLETRNAGASSKTLAKVVTDFKGLWPNSVILHGRPRHSQSQGFIATFAR